MIYRPRCIIGKLVVSSAALLLQQCCSLVTATAQQVASVAVVTQTHDTLANQGLLSARAVSTAVQADDAVCNQAHACPIPITSVGDSSVHRAASTSSSHRDRVHDRLDARRSLYELRATKKVGSGVAGRDAVGKQNTAVVFFVF